MSYSYHGRLISRSDAQEFGLVTACEGCGRDFEDHDLRDGLCEDCIDRREDV